MAFQIASGANSRNSAQGLGKQRVLIVTPVVKAGSINRDADGQAQAPALHVAIDSSLRITKAFIIKGALQTASDASTRCNGRRFYLFSSFRWFLLKLQSTITTMEILPTHVLVNSVLDVAQASLGKRVETPARDPAKRVEVVSLIIPNGSRMGGSITLVPLPASQPTPGHPQAHAW